MRSFSGPHVIEKNINKGGSQVTTQQVGYRSDLVRRAVAVALTAALGAGHVCAAEAVNDDLEEVQVTGTRIQQRGELELPRFCGQVVVLVL
jgi:hypothetical protein